MVQSIADQLAASKVNQPSQSGPWWTWLIIDPRTSKRLGFWDAVTSIALVFTAIVTPMEVGFLRMPDDRWVDPLFLINRIVDLIFVTDMTLQFFLMYPKHAHSDNAHIGGGQWVSDMRQIARHNFVSPWFYLDAFSISVSGFDIFTPTGSGASRLKALRAVRVLRLLKLVRLARGSRIFKRWEIRLSINYALLSIAIICIMLLFVCHLFACIWGLQASFDPLGTWTGQKGYCVPHGPADGPCPEGNTCDLEEEWSCVSAADQYLYSLYWAIATVTSIGYGDVVATPLKFVEQLICVCMMLSGSLLFAYLVGSFCGLAANLSPDVVSFRQDLTELNRFLAQNSIPNQLRYRLREYMHQTVTLRRAHTSNRLLNELAPKLRNEVALTINRKWLQKIDLLAEGCEEAIVLELAFSLHLQVFPPSETCPIGQLYIVSRGAALFAGRAFLFGKTFGEGDALLTNPKLRSSVAAAAISYFIVVW